MAARRGSGRRLAKGVSLRRSSSLSDVTHVVRTLDPKAGGLALVPIRLAAAQARLGADVAVIANEIPPPESEAGRDLAAIPGWRQVTAVQTGKHEKGLLERLKPGILHLHGVWDPIIRDSARWAAKAGVPYIITPHGMLHPWSLAQKKWKKRIALWLGYRRMLNRAAAIHALNADEAKVLAPLRLSAPTYVLPNGIDLEDIVLDEENPGWYYREGSRANRRYILFLGRLHFKKGLDILADAFAPIAELFPDVDLVVAGPEDGAGEDFRRRIEAAKLNGRVFLPGLLHGREKIATLARASCFVLPSRQEGFSLAILEALACGVPVAISTECNFPEVATAGAGIETNLEPQNVAEALGQLLSDPIKSKSMGQAGRTLVAENYRWSVIAERFLKLYGNFSARKPL